MKYFIYKVFISLFILQIVIAQNSNQKNLEYYKKLLSENPESYEGLYGKARELSFSGQMEAAIRAYTTLLEKYPADADGLLGRGRTYAWGKFYAKAEKDIKNVVKNYPDYGDALSALGDVYFWSNNFAEAYWAYDKWISLDPDQPEPFISMVKVNISERKFVLARKNLAKAEQRGFNQQKINEYKVILDRIPGATDWEYSIYYDFLSFQASRPNSSTVNFSVKRDFSKRTVIINLFNTERFNKADAGFNLDLYQELWNRSYGNLKLQIVPQARISPASDVFIEIYQGFGRGWEFSGSYRNMNFSNTSVDIYGISVGKNINAWYLRNRSSLIPKDVGIDFSSFIFTRKYINTVDNYIEAGFGKGWENEFSQIKNKVILRQKTTLLIKYQYFLTPLMGFLIIGKIETGFDSGYDKGILIEFKRRV
ncbi:MAG: YaiO family outer membrane beta-barrel protein [Candidatus Neomarinimicrobiota bacterium]